MTTTLILPDSPIITDHTSAAIQPEESLNSKPQKHLGLPMQYVAEDELDKIAGSIRIKL